MSEAWQVKSTDKIHGPFSFTQLRKLVASGRVQRDTPIRPSENTIWIAAESVDGLFDLPAQTSLEPTHAPADEAAELTLRNASQTDRFQHQPTAPSGTPEPALDFPQRALDFADPAVTWDPPTPVKRAIRFLSKEPDSPWDLFDWRFERYLTPWIIRVTWLLILIVSTLWILYAVANAGYAVIFDRTILHDLKLAQKAAAPPLRPGDAPRPAVEFDPDRLGETRIAALTWAVGSILATGFSLLYLRVLCEFLIVAFNIAASLRRLEQLSEQSRE